MTCFESAKNRNILLRFLIEFIMASVSDIGMHAE